MIPTGTRPRLAQGPNLLATAMHAQQRVHAGYKKCQRERKISVMIVKIYYT